jgi:hypothetical protein
MKKALFLITVITIATIGILSARIVTAQQVVVVEMPAQATSQPILDATIQLYLYKPQLDENGNPTGNFDAVRGLGTLTRQNGEVVIVTHNHWGDMLRQAVIVEFRTAGNETILQLDPVIFRGLIRFQDAGTLILALPYNWDRPVTATSMGDSNALQTGQTVFIAYRRSTDRSVVDVLPAIVEIFKNHEGLNAMRLRTVDGTPILNGDSGGGIWVNGQLVANMWATVLSPDGNSHTNQSIGAVSPSPQQISAVAEPGDIIELQKIMQD